MVGFETLKTPFVWINQFSFEKRSETCTIFLKGMIMKRRIIPMAFLAITLITTSACANPVRNAIFQPPTKALSLDELTPDAKFIEVETADKLKLKGIYVPPKGDKPILLVSVSYTHLDVYKRQAMTCCLHILNRAFLRCRLMICLLYTSRCV